LASSSNASAQNHWQPLIHKIHIQRRVVGGIRQLLNLLNKANYWDIRISPHEKPMLKTGKPWNTSINSYWTSLRLVLCSPHCWTFHIWKIFPFWVITHLSWLTR
jgi:hypothetical protein